MVIVSAISVGIPLFLLQKGLERVDAVYVGYLTAFVPVFAFFLELTEPYFQFELVEFILVILLSFIIFLSAYIRGRTAKRKFKH